MFGCVKANVANEVEHVTCILAFMPTVSLPICYITCAATRFYELQIFWNSIFSIFNFPVGCLFKCNETWITYMVKWTNKIFLGMTGLWYLSYCAPDLFINFKQPIIRLVRFSQTISFVFNSCWLFVVSFKWYFLQEIPLKILFDIWCL